MSYIVKWLSILKWQAGPFPHFLDLISMLHFVGWPSSLGRDVGPFPCLISCLMWWYGVQALEEMLHHLPTLSRGTTVYPHETGLSPHLFITGWGLVGANPINDLPYSQIDLLKRSSLLLNSLLPHVYDWSVWITDLSYISICGMHQRPPDVV